jgi:hypothetical protein
MATCKVCGNDYDHSFEIVRNGQSTTYDCFECAIHDLAPSCAHCQCRVIGHGVAVGEMVYCCAHCANAHGAAGVTDNAAHRAKAPSAPFI